MPSTTLSPDAWRDTQSIPDLEPGGLYVFRVDLPATAQFESKCSGVLSEQELKRIARFKKEQDRNLALISRGVLRCLLSKYLGVSPQSIPLRTGPAGKPEADGISFNIAHSGDVILIALTRNGLLGVDVELINPATPVLEIADRYFAPTEIAAIRAENTDTARQAVFFRQWARKESIIKADGRGLSLPLSSFAAENITRVPDSTGALRTYSVHTLPMEADYAAAVATDNLSAVPSLFLYPQV